MQIESRLPVMQSNTRPTQHISHKASDELIAVSATTDVIKNTYHTLMTRGQKGCFTYCTDQETREHRQKITSRQLEKVESTALGSPSAHKDLDLPVTSFEQAKPYQGYVPIFDLEAAAGGFSDRQSLGNADNPEESEWVQLPEHINTTVGMFVTRVVGESMSRRIINGSWCLLKANPGGSRNGKIVLVQHRDIKDSDHEWHIHS